MIAIVGIRYRKSCLPIYGIAITRSQWFLFLDDFEGNANISVAIKTGSPVAVMKAERCDQPSWVVKWSLAGPREITSVWSFSCSNILSSFSADFYHSRLSFIVIMMLLLSLRVCRNDLRNVYNLCLQVLRWQWQRPTSQQLTNTDGTVQDVWNRRWPVARVPSQTSMVR